MGGHPHNTRSRAWEPIITGASTPRGVTIQAGFYGLDTSAAQLMLESKGGADAVPAARDL
jgi:hypothetical protein